MAPTILFKFCVFIVHSKPNNMTLSAFSGKILELEKQFLIFWLTRNVASKTTDQYCSNSISGVPLQIFPVSLFLYFFFFFFFICFRSTLKMKGSSHQKKIKNYCFLKNCFNDFHKILWIYSTFEPHHYDIIGYSRKILETKKKNFFIFLSPSLATKPTD